MRQFTIIMVMTLVGGFCLAAGALILALAIRQPGLYLGAAIGGLAGIYLNVKIVSRLGLIRPTKHVYSGTAVGTVAAYFLALLNITNPAICLAAPLLIGVGAIIGERYF
jgi:hypothetical protein